MCVCVCVCVCVRIAEHAERMIYGRDDDRSKGGSEKLYNFIANVLQSELYRALIVKADAPIQQLSYLINMYVYVCERELVGLQLSVCDLSGVCVCVCVYSVYKYICAVPIFRLGCDIKRDMAVRYQERQMLLITCPTVFYTLITTVLPTDT